MTLVSGRGITRKELNEALKPYPTRGELDGKFAQIDGKFAQVVSELDELHGKVDVLQDQMEEVLDLLRNGAGPTGSVDKE